MRWTAPERHRCARLAAVEVCEQRSRPLWRLPRSVWTSPSACSRRTELTPLAARCCGAGWGAAEVLDFFRALRPCLVGIEACGTAHHWARELTKLGHTVRMMPPSYVKGYVKRSKNDAADAAAICEAVTRPSMRFVPIKTAEQQAA